MTIIVGLDNILKKLENIEMFFTWARSPMEESLALVHNEIAVYKPKAQGAFSNLATIAQKRAYWAKVRSGEIAHGVNGYIRSGTLGRKWVTRISYSANSIEGIVGNNTEYAPYVQRFAQPGGQQPFHATTGFQTDRGALDATERQRKDAWENAINRIV